MSEDYDAEAWGETEGERVKALLNHIAEIFDGVELDTMCSVLGGLVASYLSALEPASRDEARATFDELVDLMIPVMDEKDGKLMKQ